MSLYVLNSKMKAAIICLQIDHVFDHLQLADLLKQLFCTVQHSSIYFHPRSVFCVSFTHPPTYIHHPASCLRWRWHQNFDQGKNSFSVSHMHCMLWSSEFSPLSPAPERSPSRCPAEIPLRKCLRVIVRDECLSLCGGGVRGLYFLPTVSDFFLLKAEALVFQDLSSSICSQCVTLTFLFFFWSRMLQGLACSPECAVLEAS